MTGQCSTVGSEITRPRSSLLLTHSKDLENTVHLSAGFVQRAHMLHTVCVCITATARAIVYVSVVQTGGGGGGGRGYASLQITPLQDVGAEKGGGMGWVGGRLLQSRLTCIHVLRILRI